MGNYIVTDKHPAYKEGLAIINDALILPKHENWGGILPETCETWLEDGWIEEELVFSELEMLTFAVHYASVFYSIERGGTKVYSLCHSEFADS